MRFSYTWNLLYAIIHLNVKTPKSAEDGLGHNVFP